jgi:serine/threonine protein kinase
MANHLLREIAIQSRLDHKNIVQLLAVFFDDENVYLVLELCWRGSLYDQLQRKGRLSEQEAKVYCRQLTSALVFMQEQSVIHRDLKPDNVLLNHKGELKLADWGSSVYAPPPGSTVSEFIGTLDYLAPEMIARRGYSHRVDNWALGVLAYELIVGKAPFSAEGMDETFVKIARADLRFPSDISADARDLIQRLLRKQPAERMPLTDVLRLLERAPASLPIWESSPVDELAMVSAGKPAPSLRVSVSQNLTEVVDEIALAPAGKPAPSLCVSVPQDLTEAFDELALAPADKPAPSLRISVSQDLKEAFEELVPKRASPPMRAKKGSSKWPNPEAIATRQAAAAARRAKAQGERLAALQADHERRELRRERARKFRARER